ncbi:prolyl-tRNA synthetase [Atopostipes suicloacalis DSM 15692]|uniref:Proline--tRNA ligase n=1 Tax=Atopostipes suicloacalis DSM 15692 TaxID=1121025 RepID=A0A1M4TGN9_9LACT|nr:proline--tRNA ligase [Atopostipes suicloacalis]SHE43596.1 prolyl-tRNA synthetase [Atopostipes suicloacalis DSM 15692]
MKQSQIFIPTLRETPSDAEVASHQLMLRAGFIRQISAGIYTYMPLAWRVIKKIENIIREELDAVGGTEMLLPTLIPADLWRESGRFETYGPEMMELKDRHNRDFLLGPTHEETFTKLVRDDIKSYKKLPLHLYQIQTKYRDEKRPRFGLLRSREFLMKDSYTFHDSYDSLDDMYNDIWQAYDNIFTRIGLNYRSIIADAGAMGGKESIEFIAMSDVGEDTIAYSTESEYAANIEMASSKFKERTNTEVQLQKELIDTPDTKTIDELAELLSISKAKILKSVLLVADGTKPIMAIIRGDHDVNEIKVRMAVGAETIEHATEEQIKELFAGLPAGYVGPLDLGEEVTIVADLYVKNMVNAVAGANQENKHYINITPSRDFEPDTYTDIRMVQEGDLSPDGQGTLQFTTGIEIGHIFKLGTRFSETMGANVLDKNGKPTPVIMGSYGIGISRLLSAISEQYLDERGLVWPDAVAPFDVHIVPINYGNEDQRILTDELNELFTDEGFEVLIDDRKERPGVKFTDAELIGIPIRITVGKKAEDGIVEVSFRRTNEMVETRKEEIIDTISILKTTQENI